MIGVTDRHADQQFRSLLASLEILAAAAVSNAIVLGSFIRDRGEKKRRFRFGSNAGASSLDRPPTTPKKTLTNMEWGSDTDLVSGLGMRCSPSLTERRQSDMMARPAPIALPTAEQANRLTPAYGGKGWASQQRQRQDSADTMNIDLEKSQHKQFQPPKFHPEVPTTPRGGMSFFDVGGLLIHNDAPRSPRSPHSPVPRPSSSSATSPHPRNFSYPSPMPSPRTTVPPNHFQSIPSNAGSAALLQDIGGLLHSDQSQPRSQSQDSHRGYFDLPAAESGTDHPTANSTARGGRHDRDGVPAHDVLLEEDEEEAEAEPQQAQERRLGTPNGRVIGSRPTTPTRRYAPLQQGGRAGRELMDVGGLLS